MEELIAKIKDAQISIKLDNGQLRVRGEKGSISADLLTEIKEHKAALITYLDKDVYARIPAKKHQGESYFELSLFQHELWLNEEVFKGHFYNQVRPFILEGALDIPSFEKAAKDLIDRYEILRTTFHLLDDQPYQRVNSRTSLFDTIIDFTDFEGTNNAYEKATAQVSLAGKEPYNLEKGPLIKFKLIKISTSRYLFALLSHHIIMDGWSAQIIMQDLVARYHFYTKGIATELEALEFQYKEFAAAQNRKLKFNQLNQHRHFWEGYLKGEIPRLHLPTDFPRPAVKSFKGSSVVKVVDQALTAQIQRYCKEKNVTLFIFFQSIVKALLYRYSGQEDLIVGSVFAGRESKEMEKQVGSFANILPVRTQLNAQLTFAQLIDKIKEDIFEIYIHQFYPFNQITKDLGIAVDQSHAPLFDVMVMVQNFQGSESSDALMSEIEITPIEVEATSNTLDLYFIVNERKDGQIELDICYSEDLFKKERMEVMHLHLVNLLKQVLADDDQKVSEIAYLTKEEEFELLHTFNDTSIGAPTYESILDLFDEMVGKYPKYVALAWQDVSLTYEELQLESNQLAIYLRNNYDIKAGDFVGVLAGRNPFTIISMLAIMKLRAVFMPIEEDLPLRRIEEMCDLMQISLLVSISKYQHRLATFDHIPRVLVDQVNSSDIQGDLLTGYEVKSSDPAYIVFTSGSTGKPKPIVAKHEGLINNVYDYIPKLGLVPEDNYLQFFATGFDGFFFDIFPILGGATLVMIDKATINDREKFLSYLERHQITMTAITPSYLDVLERQDLPSLRSLISAGEAVDSQAAMYYATHKNFYNLYGPAEGTVIASFYQVEPGKKYDSIPIGKPCANKLLYILDDQLRLLPKGIPGEICISGAGVVDGYYHDPIHSAEKFVANPFVPGLRLYRTGDLGQWTEEGNLLFLGRKDSQIKINGYRVEIGEIEKSVLMHPSIAKAVVLVDQKDRKLELACFFQRIPSEIGESGSQKVLSPLALRQYLAQRIPVYMVPARFIEVLDWPVTAQGKVDHKKLMQLAEKMDTDSFYAAPTNAAEEKIKEIWEGILKVENIGIHDHFFEIGGDSLLSIRVISAIRKEFNQELSVRTIFSYPNIQALATYLLDGQHETALPPPSAEVRPNRIPLSYAQERLWIIDQIDGSVQYHMPSVIRLKNQLDVVALENALVDLVTRHEVLRTVFKSEDDQSYQEVMPAGEWRMAISQSSFLEQFSGLNDFIIKEVNRPFDLSKDYLLRAHLLESGPDDHLLIIVMHHIASDGWSISLLVQDLMEIYTARQDGRNPDLLPLPIQYADYAIWQRKYVANDFLETQLDWWAENLKGLEVLKLSTDFPRPAIQSTEGGTVSFSIEKEILEGLKLLTVETGSTLFITLLAAFKVLLYRYSGQADICVGTPLANRNHQEVEALVGFFINTLVLRTDLSGNPTFSSLLEQVKSSTLNAFNYQEVPFEKIVDRLAPERNLSTSPIFQVMFVLQNIPELIDLELGGLQVSFESVETNTAKYDLTFSAFETPQSLEVGIVYCSALFTRKTIEVMAQHFQMLLQAIVNNPSQNIAQLPMLGQKEEAQLLSDFNDTLVQFPQGKSMVALLEEQVAKTPQQAALQYNGTSLTYQQLDQRSNQLANYLIKKGVVKESLVAICMHRKPEMIIAIWGILKSGAAYVPIDPEYPIERIRYLLEDSEVEVVLTTEECCSLIPEKENLQQLVFEQDWPLIQLEEDTATAIHLTDENLVYVIYTSGSTGRPKGVLIEQGSLLNYLYYSQGEYGSVLKNLSFPLFTSLSFDLTQTSIFLTLFSGGTLLIEASNEIEEVFTNILEHKQLNAIKLTPSHIHFLEGRKSPNLQLAIVGGERLERQHVRILREVNPRMRIINEYGPTEATIGCTVFEVFEESAPILIGRPIANTQIYLLDENGSLVPRGVTGELCIGGKGLARAYWRRPELTAEKFAQSQWQPGVAVRIYKTGDLARYQADGNLEFLGRKDDQVKIRGYRIELGEIESVLQQAPAVKGAVVLAREGANSQKRLVAYVVGEEDFDQNQVKKYLEARLPQYMVPSILLELPTLPLTTNGKVDLKALPDPDLAIGATTEYVSPENEIEAQLVSIWQELLNRDKIGIQDNFFELGGDSIITIQVASRGKHLGFALKARDIFQHQTISALAKHIVDSEAEATLSEQGLLNGPSGFLPIQHWFFEQENPVMAHYNQSVLLQIDKGISREQLSTIVEALFNQHDALRFRYSKEKEGWQQSYDASVKGNLEVLNLSEVSADSIAAEITKTCEAYQRSLQLEEGRICKMVLIETPEQDPRNRFLMVIHHLAVDGVSWRVLFDDLKVAFAAVSNGKEITFDPKGSSYRQWVSALQKYAESEQVRLQLPFWEATKKEYKPLPLHQPVSVAKFGDLESYGTSLSTTQTDFLLKEVNQAYHTEINDILLSALSLTIAEWTGNLKMAIGLEGHGREAIFSNIDTSNVVGWFTSLYPVLLTVGQQQDEGDLIRSIKEQLRAIPEKGMGYGLLRYLHPLAEVRRKLSETKWDIVFNYLGQVGQMVNSSTWLHPAEESDGKSISDQYPLREKLLINGFIVNGQLYVSWSYAVNQFQPETIKHLAERYLENLSRLIAHCQGKEYRTLTPADHGFAGEISNQELDTLNEFLNEEEWDGDEILKF